MYIYVHNAPSYIRVLFFILIKYAYIYTYIYIYIYVYVCIYINVYIYICMYYCNNYIAKQQTFAIDTGYYWYLNIGIYNL